MQIKISLTGAILVAVIFAACTVNFNQSNANTGNANALPKNNTAAQKPWSVVVCSARSKSVTLSAGTSDKDGEVFATWQDGAAQRKFELPARLQSLSKIYFKGSASDKNQVEMCILYDGKPKKRVEFDDDEDVFVSSSDVDDLDKCRCTE